MLTLQTSTTSKHHETKQLTTFKLYITFIHNIILGLLCNKSSEYIAITNY